MCIQPMLPQRGFIHILRSSHGPKTSGATTVALKWLLHIPFGAWIEKRNVIAFLERLFGDNSNFELGHVENDAWIA